MRIAVWPCLEIAIKDRFQKGYGTCTSLLHPASWVSKTHRAGWVSKNGV